MRPSTTVTVGLALGILLLAAGLGSVLLAQQTAQACHEEWDDVPDAHADCEDALHVLMLDGGAVVAAFGVVLLAAAGWEHRTDGER